MATGAASQLAGPAGVGPLRVPLLWMTVGVALAVIATQVASGSWRPRHQELLPRGQLGDFTVPIGLAVIGSGLARLGGPAALGASAAAVALAWLLTALLAATVMAPLAVSPPGLAAVGGAWFLAPAALLADAIGIAAVAGRVTGHGPVPGWLALAVTAGGAVGYLALLGGAAARVAAHRLAGVPRAPWWIAAGCGGLSAAAVGHVAAIDPLAPGAAARHDLGLVALVFWALASAVLVPVIATSIGYLVGLRRLSGRPPWPPTFSTGVYALGAGQAGRLLGSAWITRVGDVAAAATLGLWVLTVLAHASRRPPTLRVPAGDRP